MIASLALSAVSAPPTPQHQTRLSLRAQNEPVRSVLLRLARESGASIAVGQGVTGYVTVALHAVTVPQALAAILNPLGDTFRVHDGVYDVEPGTNAPNATASGSRCSASNRRARASRGSAVTGALPAKFDSRGRALQRAARARAAGRRAGNAHRAARHRRPQSHHAGHRSAGTRTVRADAIAGQLHASFPAARIAVVGAKQVLVTALPQDLAQIKAVLSALDAPSTTPAPVAGPTRCA